MKTINPALIAMILIGSVAVFALAMFVINFITKGLQVAM